VDDDITFSADFCLAYIAADLDIARSLDREAILNVSYNNDGTKEELVAGFQVNVAIDRVHGLDIDLAVYVGCLAVDIRNDGKTVFAGVDILSERKGQVLAIF